MGQGQSGDLHDADGQHAGGLFVLYAFHCSRAGGERLLHHPPEPLRLYAKRDELKKKLLDAIGNDEGAMKQIMESLSLPAALKV